MNKREQEMKKMLEEVLSVFSKGDVFITVQTKNIVLERIRNLLKSMGNE